MSNFLESVQSEIAQLRNKIRRMEERADANVTYAHEIQAVWDSFPHAEASSMEVKIDYSGDFTVSIIGSKEDLYPMWAALRKMGYEPTSRIREEDKSYYTSFFSHKERDSIWFTFSSNVCEQKIVGYTTQTVQTPIYETVCA